MLSDKNGSSSPNNEEISVDQIVIKKENYTPLKFFRCKYPSCSFKTLFEVKYRLHYKRKHRLSCLHCPFVGKTRQSLLKHEGRHIFKQSAQCSVCSYSCKSQSHLGNHFHFQMKTKFSLISLIYYYFIQSFILKECIRLNWRYQHRFALMPRLL